MCGRLPDPTLTTLSTMPPPPCRLEIRPQNSSRTSEILRCNSASTSEIFITKASRIGELTQPANTVGKAGKAITM
ncbi:hypothetical protein E2C01_008392 [Portunus trituberculatus]|uniref:Uncharacterized protein n=1 Tax=Portunus trituberculatus TaxID=210409 RepID=A0A5B7D5D7_PORTR|nr:hypothetical protein [Portunus trituberculatus]